MSLLIPAGPFGAYLFDCDGTIADSMPLHLEAWQSALKRWGAAFPEDLFYAWAGTPTSRIVELLNERLGLQMPPEAVTHAKEEIYGQLLHRVQPIREVVEQIHGQHGKLRMAVVSGSPKVSILKTLAALGLGDRFDAIVGPEDYRRGKPDPECYLLAARLLGVKPAGCLVFEDAELGIQSAEAAGMKWVRVPA